MNQTVMEKFYQICCIVISTDLTKYYSRCTWTVWRSSHFVYHSLVHTQFPVCVCVCVCMCVCVCVCACVCHTIVNYHTSTLFINGHTIANYHTFTLFINGHTIANYHTFTLFIDGHTIASYHTCTLFTDLMLMVGLWTGPLNQYYMSIY